jgi:hypothetical protein
MKSRKIRVKIEIVECEEEPEKNPAKVSDGEFEMIISEQQATSIDDCEQALLETNYEAIRDAVRRHMSEVSKKKSRDGQRGRNKRK